VLTAAGARIRQARALVAALAIADLRLRYGRGSWRLAWWLLDPVAALGVYLVLVRYVLHLPGRAPGLSVACALVPFQLLIMSVVSALGVISMRAGLLANLAFPPVALPASIVLAESVAASAALSLIVVMMAVYGVAPTTMLVWTPLVIVVTQLMALAFAYPAALTGLWFPHLRRIVVNTLRAFFFLAAGIVALAQVHGTAKELLRLNPMTGLFEAYRAIFLYGHPPAVWELAYPSAFAALALLLFVPLYQRERWQFVKLAEAALT